MVVERLAKYEYKKANEGIIDRKAQSRI